MNSKVDRTEVSGSIFEAIGFSPEEAAIYEMEVALAVAIERWIKAQGLSQRRAADMLSVPASKINAIVNRNFEQTSLNYLVTMAVKAGMTPEMIFRPSAPALKEPVHVVAKSSKGRNPGPRRLQRNSRTGVFTTVAQAPSAGATRRAHRKGD